MSRHRFNELVEEYALGELDSAQEQEFHDLIEENEELAREARQTREMVRLAHLAPKATAPAGLLHGALAKARAQAADVTPPVDTTPSANVILIPSGDGKVRRIPIHSADADTSVAQADPQLHHSWRNLNWGLVAAALAAVVVGGLVAVELGPSLVGERTPQASSGQEEMYLASSTVYDSELLATPSPNPARQRADRDEGVGFAASLGRERAERFARQVTDQEAAEATTPNQDPGVLYYDQPATGGAFGPVDDSADQLFGSGRNLADGSATSAEQMDLSDLNMAASEPAPEANFGVSSFADERESRTMAEVDPSPEQPASPAMARLSAEAPAEDELAAGRVKREVAQQSETTDPEGAESVLAGTAVVPMPRVLMPLEVEFLLAQAVVTGGSEARPLGVGFAPLVPETREDGSRTQLTLAFPDRRAYESFLSRLEVTPVVAMAESGAKAESAAPAEPAFTFDSRRGTTSRGELSRAPQNGRNLPSPVTGLAATGPTPASSAPGSPTTPPRSSVAEWSLTEEREQAADEVQAAASSGVEVGKPLDLTRYRLHLTTDVQTGQVRVTVSPLQPGETVPGASPTRTPSAPPGARR